MLEGLREYRVPGGHRQPYPSLFHHRRGCRIDPVRKVGRPRFEKAGLV